MRHVWLVTLGMSLFLSGGLLGGCGDRTVPPETPSPAPESTEPEDSEPATTTEPETPTTTEPANSATAAERDGTAINPPQPARLTAQQANAQINLRSQPTTTSEAKGYGLVGDPVELRRAIAGEGGLTWYYVKFDESGAEGWIRGDFIDTRGASATPNSGANISVEGFTTDELFAEGSGGCGMTLWPVDRPNEFIFFNGLPDTGMWMKLDGTMTEFRRTAASGPEFYGQSASQTFVSNDGDITVEVTASVGSEVGYESVNIQQGQLVLEDPAGGTTEIAVAGDAGC